MIVSILTSMQRIKFLLSWVEHVKTFLYPGDNNIATISYTKFY